MDVNDTLNLNNNYTSTVSSQMNSTLSDNLTFQDIISSPCFYGSIITFIFYYYVE